ncbi:MAG: hypothetical protein ACRDHP_08975, partial [Ktedonobacterales bacterium]
MAGCASEWAIPVVGRRLKAAPGWRAATKPACAGWDAVGWREVSLVRPFLHSRISAPGDMPQATALAADTVPG